jgi:hypothetical protein
MTLTFSMAMTLGFAKYQRQEDRKFSEVQLSQQSPDDPPSQYSSSLCNEILLTNRSVVETVQ